MGQPTELPLKPLLSQDEAASSSSDAVKATVSHLPFSDPYGARIWVPGEPAADGEAYGDLSRAVIPLFRSEAGSQREFDLGTSSDPYRNLPYLRAHSLALEVRYALKPRYFALHLGICYCSRFLVVNLGDLLLPGY